ncbi:FkbM family methyltransferase [Castellaniella sp.]|uniref:FkbM family methyltransferase n=1 Tax=Castellaniella sp. TaxID=1955812 RepID=UPI002AFFC8DC|nr:FkbM family methyltransferase [Castellaniella sp.]
MNKQQLSLDGASYAICLPDAATDYIQGKIAKDKQPYELEMLRNMASHLQQGDVVLDVGANIGNHSLYLASVAGCRVEAFEPNPSLCQALQSSIALNGLGDRINVHQAGVADIQGYAHFSHLDPANLGAQSLEVSQGTDEIVLVCLDQLDLPAPIRMIKIDVEGMELQVLSGARQLIEKDSPILYVEAQDETRFSSIQDFLFELGYLFCTTFNATPTHLFLHQSQLSDLADIAGYLVEKAHLAYRNSRSQADLDSALKDSNHKYRELSERFAELKAQYQNANLKYREVSGQVVELKIKSGEQALSLKQADFQQEKLLAEQILRKDRAELELEREQLRYQTELERLKLEQERSEYALSQTQTKMNDIQAHYRQLIIDYETLKTVSDTSRAKLQQESQQLQDKLCQHEQQLNEKTAEMVQIAAGKAQAEQAANKAQDQLHDMQNQYQKMHVAHEALQHNSDAIAQQLQEQVQSLQAELEEARCAHAEQQQREHSSLQQLHRANDKYRRLTNETIPTLKQKLDAQAKRSVELYQRAEQLNQKLRESRQLKAEIQRRLTALRSSATYQVGLYVREASSSFGAAVKLPLRLWRLRHHSKHQAPAVTQSPLTGQPGSLAVLDAATLAPAVQAVDRDTLFTEGLANKPSRQVRVACIMDEFTFGSYWPECDLHQLTPESWKSELDACNPELLFIESAWRGKDELWGSKVGHCSQELQGIVAWCRERHVPTVFWNKEDPVHFETFLATAKQFDFVFTTDMDCIHRYKAALGHNQVFFLPFACQPSVHNPIEKYDRKDAFCFAGAYYVRYPERTRDLESFVKELPSYRPLEIYDRNFGKDDPNYQFPEAYKPYIVGTLPFTEIDKAYKGYRYAINLNSIKQSQTMFARRLYELLASNTLTISNFSRGVRLLFGDLVLTSDSGAEIKHRLQQLQEAGQIDRLRLAGLRKAMAEHTYAERFNYILQQVTGKARPTPLPSFAVLATAQNLDEVRQIAAHVTRQQGVELSLILVLRRGVSIHEANDALAGLTCPHAVLSARGLHGKSLLELVGSPQHWVAGMLAEDYYGPHYLLDMALATRYSSLPVIGKAAVHACSLENSTFENSSPAIVLSNQAQAYSLVQHLHARCSVIAPQVAGDIRADKWLVGLGDWQYQQLEQLSIDPYNYCRSVRAAHWQPVASRVDDLPVDTGIALSQLTQLAESIVPMKNHEAKAAGLNGNQLAQLLLGRGLHIDQQQARALSDGVLKLTRNKAIAVGITGAALELESSLADGKHEYIYAAKDLPVEQVRELAGGQGSIPLHLELEPGLALTLVVLFLDDSKARLSHQMLKPNRNTQLEIPEQTKFLRFGLRIYAGGSGRIKRLLFGHLDLEPANLLGQADILLLTNHYPSYDDLYRNGFVHSRVKAYAEQAVAVDVFRLRKDQPISWHEFQNVDVTTGSQHALRRMLGSGRYRHVLVHFLNPDMWEVLQEFINEIEVTVWVHGAEINPWYRRKFNIDTPEQEAKAKAQSDLRMAFWKGLLQAMPAKLHMVFVSNSFAQEVMEDLGFSLPEGQYSIIHNPINTELFSYIEKPIEQRKKILSIRPFASKTYANDISVKAILELSKEPFFEELQFTIIGDGQLFEEILKPLKKFKNVNIERKFITQNEIADLHKQHGLFLCPSRYDSQGVSRDEAKASGLVPLTTAVAAIPEFVSADCGILADAEDHKGLAEGIKQLYQEPDRFARMSAAAAARVRKQLDKSMIIRQELKIFSGGVDD